MKHRVHLAACLSAFAVAGVIAVPASANPGLLHKHGARPVGVPAMLPGQSPTGGPAPATAVVPAVASPATGPTASSITVATVVPGGDGVTGAAVVVGAVVGSGVGPVVLVPDGIPVGGTLVDGGPAVDPGQLPIGVGPSPDGRGPGPDGGPHFWHRPSPGAVDPGMVSIAGGVPGFDPGGIDGMVEVGVVQDSAGMPIVLYAAAPPDGPRREHGGPGFRHHPTGAVMMTSAVASAEGVEAASTAATDGAGSTGRALAGGLPNRAAGVRTDAVASVRHHGRGPMRVGAPTAEGVAVSGNDSSGSVVQAGGVAEDAAGAAAHERRPKLAASAVAGQAVVPPAATTAPRWRDRLRFAWPKANE